MILHQWPRKSWHPWNNLGAKPQSFSSLFYPDFSIGPIAYIQRVRGTGFINGGTIEGNLNNGGTTFTESPKSAGVGITLDLNLFRQTFMFDLGVKYSYVFGISDFEKGPSIEITLGSITF